MRTQGPTAPPAQAGGADHLRVLRDILEGADAESLARTPSDFSRSGPLSPQLVVALLLFLVADAGRRGYALLLEALWGRAGAVGLKLPQPEPVTAAAFCQARQKLRPEGVRELVWRAAELFEDERGDDHRWHGMRVLAVDGSRVNLQRSKKLWDSYGAAPGAGCPQATVSTLFDVVSRVPHDVHVAPYAAGERAILLEHHLERVRPGDLLVLDRGYPSFEVIGQLQSREVGFAMRARPRGGFPAVERFVDSGKRSVMIEIDVPWDNRDSDAAPIRVRAVRIQGPKDELMVVLTSLPPKGFGWRTIQELYRMRWRIESYYGMLKGTYFGQRQYHAKSPAGVEQELYAQALFVSITRHLMAMAAERTAVPYAQLGEKRAILAVAEELTRLLLSDRRRNAIDLDCLLKRISRGLVPPRPGRSYKRRSHRPTPRWNAHGRSWRRHVA